MPNAQEVVPADESTIQSSNSESVVEERTLAVNSLTFCGIPTTVMVSSALTSYRMVPDVAKHAGTLRKVSVVPSGQVGEDVGKFVGAGVGSRLGLFVG
jgi:hypothetical protein